MATVELYHYARKQDLDAISDEGLKVGSKYFMFDVPSRNNAVYCWHAPDFDVMGYSENSHYVGLKVKVETARCRIAAMELVAAAYVNHIGTSRLARNPEMAARLIAAYEKTQVPYYEFNKGMFRAPEVLVEGAIDPDDIAVIRSNEIGPRGEENRRVYAARWSEKLISLLGIQRTKMTMQELTEAALHRGVAVRVAVHDDATAWLETCMLLEMGEFFSVEKED